MGVPRLGDLAPGQTFIRPDDVFFTPDGKQIVATQEEDQVVSIIDIATRHIVYRYGSPGSARSSVGHLSNPDDAMILPDGRLMIPDIRNCRLLFVQPVPWHPRHSSAPPGSAATSLRRTLVAPTGCSRCVTGVIWLPRSTGTGSTR